MPYNRRWDAKRDESEPDIVDALEAAGYAVWRHLPVDLIVWHPSYGNGVVRLLEVKTPTPTGKAPKRKDRKDQAEFCAATGTPYVTTPAQALAAVTNSVSIGSN